MDYIENQYIYPPRADRKITSHSLDMFEGGQWIAQPKMNGSCGVLFLKGEQSSLWNRHGERMTKVQDIGFHHLSRGEGWTVLTGEYMNKNKSNEFGSFNHKFVVWDIIVHQGKHLLGQTLARRMHLLDLLYGHEEYMDIADGSIQVDPMLYQVHDNLFRVASFRNDFKALYDTITKIDMYEGFVLKRLDGVLRYGSSERNNNTWQIKCRKPTKNYAF